MNAGLEWRRISEGLADYGRSGGGCQDELVPIEVPRDTMDVQHNPRLLEFPSPRLAEHCAGHDLDVYPLFGQVACDRSQQALSPPDTPDKKAHK